MIKLASLDSLYALFSKVLYFGVHQGYSYAAIEERICKSAFLDELEKSSDAFLYLRRSCDIVRDVYEDGDAERFDYSKTNALFLWLGEAYMRLFFVFHKAMAYVFLYIPLEKMIALFDLYHEQDWSELFSYFQKVVAEETLLTKLLKKKRMNANELAQKAGVAIATVNHYRAKDEYLFEGRFATLDAIAFALDVSPRLFLSEIHNYTDSSSYRFDRENVAFQSYLGLYVCSYFDSEIGRRKYVYDGTCNEFRSKEGRLKVCRFSKPSEIETIVREEAAKAEIAKKKTVVVLIDDQQEEERFSLPCFGPYLEEVFLIRGREFIRMSKRKEAGFIGDAIATSLNERAKKSSGGDFALG